MITRHGKDHLMFHDGEREHRVKHDDFDWMRPHDKGGIHPAVTEDHHSHLFLGETERHYEGAPVKPVKVTMTHAMTGREVTAYALPVKAWLQAHYGPDKQIVSVPINGDAAAQRLHWLKRTPEEQREMKALLKWMDAWRLTEEGEMPGPDDRVISGTIDHQAAIMQARQEG
jgi:hypothetical protein